MTHKHTSVESNCLCSYPINPVHPEKDALSLIFCGVDHVI